jgi:chromosome segregation ATPase
MSAVLAPVDTPTAQLDTVRAALGKLASRQARLPAEIARCEADIAKHQTVIGNAADARLALQSLYERVGAGEKIADKAFMDAELASKNAALLAERAEMALRGTNAALARFEDEAASLDQEIQTLRAEGQRIQGTIIRESVVASRNKLKAECGEFVVSAWAEHHACIQAAQEVAQELGLLKGLSLPGPLMRTARMIGTAFNDDHGAWDFDVSDAISAKAAAHRATFAQLKL